VTTPDTELEAGWLSAEDLAEVRDRVPLVYVEAVPVRVSHLGRVERVGLLLRARPDGTISRTVVSGRVLYGETVRDALWRHLVKDLGPDCDPSLPPSPVPFTVAEYFPDGRRTGFHDPRQHAVSLAYVIPVAGHCEPSQDALEFTWLSVREACSEAVSAEMSGGHDRLVRLALAHTGSLP
jgi:ADP-ribose pyrophosphatase YjhB (NUDIX family)